MRGKEEEIAVLDYISGTKFLHGSFFSDFKWWSTKNVSDVAGFDPCMFSYRSGNFVLGFGLREKW